VIGPLARSVDDLELSLRELAGIDTLGEARTGDVLPPPRRRSLEGYRLAVWIDDPMMSIDSEVKTVLRRAIDELVAAGAKVDAASPAIDVEDALRTYFFLLGAAMGSGDPRAVARGRELKSKAPTRDERVGYAFLRGAAADVLEWDTARVAQAAIRREWARFHTSYDALLCPVAATAALPTEPGVPATRRSMLVDGVSRRVTDSMWWCALIGVAYLPSTVVPVGATPSGLPIGMQVVGPFFEDNTSLDVGRRIDAVLGGYKVPPVAATA
jgi:amidase